MKLVEILARELNQWRGDWLFCAQSGDGQIYFDNEERDQIRFERGAFLAKASDWITARVTRTQWEAERARIAAEEAPTWHIGTETEQWREECQKQYEQDLWDKVAVMILEKVTDHADTIYGAATCAADQADAFMAERAKRLNK